LFPTGFHESRAKDTRALDHSYLQQEFYTDKKQTAILLSV